MEKEFKEMYDALQAFRKNVVKAQRTAVFTDKTWEYPFIIDAIDELMSLLTDEIPD